MFLTHLNEDQEGFETWRCFEHEAGVVGEPLDVSFISCVDEDGGFVLGTTPMDIVDEVSLLEGVVAPGIVIEVIQNLSEELGSVKPVFGRRRVELWPNTGIRESRCEMAKRGCQTQKIK